MPHHIHAQQLNHQTKTRTTQTNRTATASLLHEQATLYALHDLQQRGAFFCAPGDDVYEGMVVGEAARAGADLDVKVTREKKLTNVRTVEADEKMLIAPPVRMTLEEAVGFVADDELIEVTPDCVRIRKAILDTGERARAAKRAAAADAAAAATA